MIYDLINNQIPKLRLPKISISIQEISWLIQRYSRNPKLEILQATRQVESGTYQVSTDYKHFLEVSNECEFYVDNVEFREKGRNYMVR